MKKRRLVYICDWLPPDFGAVGQYAMLFAREWAKSGWEVTLVGLTSGEPRRDPNEPIGEGTLEVIRIHRPTYEKQRLAERLLWTIVSNLVLLKAAFGSMRRADAVLFTGSPPLMLHFIAPLNLIIRKKLIYRITDFHPECLIAERGQAGFLVNVLLRLTRFWRRRIDMFEVLGLDQARRLAESGIPEERIELKRNPSPVVFSPRLRPLQLPDALRDGSGVILYSGNWGVAHDDDTFIEAYSEYFRQSRHGLKFWLNAVGAKADRVENELRRRGSFVYRTQSGAARAVAAAPYCGRRAPDYPAGCFCRLCAAFESACLHRVRKEDHFCRQRELRRALAGERRTGAVELSSGRRR